MGSPILHAKISPPAPREDYIPRPRLLERLNAGRHRRLTLVIAGPGYGKSSLLAEWLRALSAHQVHYFWCGLDSGDRDPAVFFGYLEAILQRLQPGCASGVQALLNRAARPDPEQLARVWLADLESARQARPLLLVLDDYHRLGDAPTIDEAMAAILERLPAEVHIAVASRQPPGFSVSRLRASREVNELTTEDLKFRPDEMHAFFADLAQGPPAVRDLVELCEGWIAGLQLLRQASARFQISAPDDVRVDTDDLSTPIFDYLAEEIFDRQPPPAQEFLLQTAMLDSLTPAECDALFGRTDSARWLAYLSEQELLERQRQDGPDTYRYHHLLVDFLRQKLQRDLDRATIQAWQRQAAKYYQARQRWDEAFEHALQAEDEDLAADIVQQGTPVLRLQGQRDTVQRWLDRMPPAAYDAHPQLFSHQAHLWEDRGLHEQAMGGFRKAIALAEPRDERRVLVSAWIGIGTIHERTGNLASSGEALFKALSYAEGGPVRDRCMVLSSLGMFHFYSGQNRQSAEYFRQFLELAAELGPPMQAQAMNNLVNPLLLLGEFAQALHWGEESLRIRRQAGQTPGIIHCLSNIGVVKTLQGEIGSAEAFFDEALELGGYGFHASIQANTLSNLGDVAFFKGDYALAEERYRRSIDLKEGLGDAPGLVHTWTRMSELRRLQRNLNEALACAQRAVEIGTGAVGLNQQLAAQTALALCWLAQGRLEHAIELLDKVTAAHRDTTENKYELARCLWYLAHARRALGQDEAQPLSEALTLAERWDYQFLITRLAQEYPGPLTAAVAANLQPAFTSGILLRLGAAVVPALERLLESDDHAVRQSAVARLAALGLDSAWEPLSRAALDPHSSVKMAADEALSKLAQSPPAPLHVTTLGRFSLKRNHQAIPYRAWGSRQAQSLFHYLLANAGQSVHRQELVNLLWPELAADDQATPEQGARAGRSLNELISRLRHVLEPYLPRTRSYPSRYLFSEGDAYRLELPAGSWVDAAAFEAAVQQGRQARLHGDGQEAAAHYQAAADLYQGPYLVEERYLDWCIARREALGLLALEALEMLAEWHLDRGTYEQAAATAARLLDLEPLHEQGYHLLLRAQYALGQLPAALRTYQRYEKEYCAELGAPPNPNISALHDRIRDQIQEER